MRYTYKVNIEFLPVTKEFQLIAPMPKPAKMYVPDWYKDIAPTNTKKFSFNPDGSLANDSGAVKRCVPFFDALTMGYIQETWTDIHIKKEADGRISYAYPVGPRIMTVRDHKAVTISNRYYQIECAWRMPWIPKLPKGYSAIYTHPFNRIDLPFSTTTGMVDADVFFHTAEGSGNYPFYIEKDFEGVIPAGTPMYQIIPVKRDNWKSKPVEFDKDKSISRDAAIRKHFINTYKKNFWHKKSYE